ncbi:putative peptidoglycan binding protein [Oceaniovalibus guishaninsula JLT2003]|uniref:Putative peptidoglycan binding protein n=1 Tax=Oceaniovalibus guishaninsula JLT2003 TaxID=1231392 RepID=K2HKW3_9RHOB|nr:putative peptidoglycan binding protein [Oceaniovalibus guishaninsula JLT2003]
MPAVAAVPDAADGGGPVLDLAQIDATGRAVIAGRARPGTVVEIALDDTTLASEAADDAGMFVVTTTVSPASQPRMLTLRTAGDPAPRRVEPALIVAPSRDGKSGTAQPSAAPTLLEVDDRGVSVLQEPADDADTALGIDSIAYGKRGQVALTGRGPVESAVRLYLDGDPLAVVRPDRGGQWRATLPKMAAGLHVLRADQLGSDGSVVARIETPFKPASAAILAEAATLSSDPKNRVVVVQPGQSLWRIAVDTYGDGFLYVKVFDANADRIRNPDLIYPGQVFTVPEPDPAPSPGLAIDGSRP